MSRLFSPLLGCLLALWAANAQSAGFDCAKAATRTEKAICQDPGLDVLDGQMAAQFVSLLGHAKGAKRAKLLSDQRAWLQSRNAACGAASACLTETTEKRQRHLDALAILEREGRGEETLTSIDARPSYPRVMMVCSPRLALFDVRLPNGDETSIAGLADVDAAALVFDGERVSSVECRLNNGQTITLRYRDFGGHGGACGGVWQPAVSVWLNGRKVVSNLTLAEGYCPFEATDGAVSIVDGTVRICLAKEMDKKDPRYDPIQLTRKCEVRAVQTVLAGPIDPAFVPAKANTSPRDQYRIVDGAGDGQCRDFLVRWNRKSDDDLKDHLQPELEWRTTRPEPESPLDLRFEVSELDLNGDGRPEALVRFEYSSHRNEGRQLLVAENSAALQPTLSMRLQDIFLKLNEQRIPNQVFEAVSKVLPAEYYDVDILKPYQGHRRLLVRYTKEDLYRSWASDSKVPVRLLLELDEKLALHYVCKIAPVLRKEDRL